MGFFLIVSHSRTPFNNIHDSAVDDHVEDDDNNNKTIVITRRRWRKRRLPL